MKVKIVELIDEIFGIELIAETVTEHGILSRFLENGIKINACSSSSLQLTFRDLMSKESCVTMLLEEALKEANKMNSEKASKNMQLPPKYNML